MINFGNLNNYVKKEYQKYLDNAVSKKKENKRILQKFKKMKPSELVGLFHELHDDAFEIINCLECAGCCSSISPAVKDTDISRISKHLKFKPSQVVEKYMFLDEEQDYVMNSTPCPFLLSDNYCSIYESRPLACKGYPHTDQSKMHGILDLTLKNTKVCPAVCYIFERAAHML